MHDDTRVTDVPILEAGITYNEVLERFLKPNLPFIVRSETAKWPASHEWIRRTAKTGSEQQSEPAWDFLVENYGHSLVTVKDCCVTTDDSCDSLKEPTELTFSSVVDLWKSGEGRHLYIKDWHLPREVQNSATGTGGDKPRAFFDVPVWAQDDWMHNYYHAKMADDFSFVYFGAAGTSTPLHRDVYTSYSWSANVLGRKRWHFIRPSEVKWCRTDPKDEGCELVKDIRPRQVNHIRFPDFASRVRVVTVEQEEGSVIFVPSDWHHQVENISPYVISINRNWCNSVNIRSMYRSMAREVGRTEAAMVDVKEIIYTRRADLTSAQAKQREWENAVQTVVAQNAGWNWRTFWQMISYNVEHPATEAACRPSDDFVYEQLRDVINAFGHAHFYIQPTEDALIEHTHHRTKPVSPSRNGWWGTEGSRSVTESSSRVPVSTDDGRSNDSKCASLGCTFSTYDQGKVSTASSPSPLYASWLDAVAALKHWQTLMSNPAAEPRHYNPNSTWSAMSAADTSMS